MGEHVHPSLRIVERDGAIDARQREHHTPAEAPNPIAWITGLRSSLGLNQEEFAARIGASRGMVARWETGVTRPGYEHVFALLELERRIHGSDPRAAPLAHPDDAKRRLLYQYFDALPAERQLALFVSIAAEATRDASATKPSSNE